MNRALHPLYARHYHMMRRCYDDTFPGYENCGGLGLDVCKRWHNMDNYFEDIENMFGLPPAHGIQLVRKNQEKGWYPNNILGWDTQKGPARNRLAGNHMLTYKGKTQPIAVWAEQLGIKHDTLWSRIDMGWPVKQAIETPVGVRRKKK